MKKIKNKSRILLTMIESLLGLVNKLVIQSSSLGPFNLDSLLWAGRVENCFRVLNFLGLRDNMGVNAHID